MRILKNTSFVSPLHKARRADEISKDLLGVLLLRHKRLITMCVASHVSETFKFGEIKVSNYGVLPHDRPGECPVIVEMSVSNDNFEDAPYCDGTRFVRCTLTLLFTDEEIARGRQKLGGAE